MLSIVTMIAQNLFYRVEDRVGEAVVNARRSVIFLSLAGLLLVTAYVLAVIGACIELGQRYGAAPALFGLAAALLFAAVIAVGILALLNRRERQARLLKRQELAARQDMMAAASGLVAGRPFVATGLALALGFLASSSKRPRSRRRR